MSRNIFIRLDYFLCLSDNRLFNILFVSWRRSLPYINYSSLLLSHKSHPVRSSSYNNVWSIISVLYRALCFVWCWFYFDNVSIFPSATFSKSFISFYSSRFVNKIVICRPIPLVTTVWTGDSKTAITREQLCGHIVSSAMRGHAIMEETFSVWSMRGLCNEK
jgi:hypothetical protein